MTRRFDGISPCDLLGRLGVLDTARALPLVEEVRRRIPWADPFWEGVFEAAGAAPDPTVFFLNLSKLCDALPPGALAGAFAAPENRLPLGALLGGSESIPERFAGHPELFSRLVPGGGLRRRTPESALVAEAHEAADRCETEEEVKGALRRIRNREMAAIAARDLAGISPLSEVMQDLSVLASASLSGAVRFSRRKLNERYGTARIPDGGGPGRECGFVVMGMGKLGAFELNFSSDIDLIYFYEADGGMTGGGADGKRVTLHQYFVRLGEVITRILSEATEDGLVFRVDLRLRPDGANGEIANSLRAAEVYYESWGLTWERAAMIKARPVAGDAHVGEEFLRMITPFVYRRSLDFTSIEEIKEMKDRVDLAAARRRRGGRDLKLGPGGIREIEFFAQAHQLIYGGKDPRLRLRGTVEALRALAEAGIVAPDECAALVEAYGFLRRLEHRIQAFQERQTHSLPQRDEDRTRLARAMGLSSAAELIAALDRTTDAVRAIYGRLFRAGEEEKAGAVPPEVEWLLYHEAEEHADARMRELGFSDPETARRNIAALRDGPPFTRLPARARRYLDKIAPLIVDRAIRTPDPDLALAHMERFLSAVGARTMFYALLFENQRVIDALVRLFGSSRFLSGFVLRHPEMLDTFLRKDLSPLVKSKLDLRRELGESLAACEDFEQELDELRRFKNVETLRIGLHDLAGNLSLEEGMFQLSALAEVLLSYALLLARREVARKFGLPAVAEEGGAASEARFCVMGMGKLGAEELTYHSDLDIIFIYRGSGETIPHPASAEGSFRKVSNHEYFAKLAQRLISILTTVTREGHVYKLDTRLRPSGNAGPLVCSLAAFERYHQESAQLWERQALLKCRFVAGDRDLGRLVEKLVARFVYEQSLPEGAAAEIHRLRKRMEVELGKERSDRRNLKVGRGGIVDVEFAVQYLQLRHGPGNPSLRSRSTLTALYELARAKILSEEDFLAMDEGYRFLRSLEVGLRLSQDSSIERFDPSVLSPGRRETYPKVTEKIRGTYLKILGIPG